MSQTSEQWPIDPALFVSREMDVQKDWIDYNGHMNLAYYHVLFDWCCDEFVPKIGCGPDYRRRTNHTIYTVDARVRYRRELHLGDTVVSSLQLLNFDDKRVHLTLSLFHIEGWLSATSELLWLHIDQSGPSATAFPDEVQNKIGLFQIRHAKAGVPGWIGSSVAGGKFD